MSDYALDDSAFQQLERENERLKAALRDIANANGDECHVMSNLRFIEGYHEGVKEQAKRARHALGEGAPPEYPANVLLALVERLKVERDLAVRVATFFDYLLAQKPVRYSLAMSLDDGVELVRFRDGQPVTVGDIRKVLAWYREAQNTEKGGE